MIPFYATNADAEDVVQFDDPGTDDDLGDSFVARMLSVTIEGVIGGFAHLRRIVQAVSVTTTATVVVTPIADKAEDATQATTFNFDASVDGQEVVADARPDVSGSRFQVEVEVTAHEGLTELGEADVFFNKRRGQR